VVQSRKGRAIDLVLWRRSEVHEGSLLVLATVAGSTWREADKDRAERRKVEVGVANQYAATAWC